MSYNVNLQHIVFRTYRSQPTIPENQKRQILSYINTFSKQFNTKILRINAHLNHVHIIIDLNPNITIPEYIKAIKANSSRVFNGHPDFPLYDGWAKRYGSFSISRWDKDKIINYIKDQEEHHKHKTFQEELIELFGKEVLNDKWWRHDWLDEELPIEAVPPALQDDGID